MVQLVLHIYGFSLMERLVESADLEPPDTEVRLQSYRVHRSEGTVYFFDLETS